MARLLEDQTNVEAPSADYPSGRIKNDSGVGDGTPVSESLYGDIQQFFAKLFRDAGSITPNGLPDNETNGWQTNDALNLSQKKYDNEAEFSDSNITLAAGWVTDPNYPIQVRKIGNKVEWRGMAYNSGTVGNNTPVLSSFGVHLRPLTSKGAAVYVANGGGRLGSIDFLPSGTCTLRYESNPGTDARVLFDNVAYYV